MAEKKEKKIPGAEQPGEPDPKLNAIKAHKEADKDIEEDPDLNSEQRPEDDLDEGELARLEGEE